MSYFNHRLEQLKREKETLSLWAKVYNTPLGKKALDELKRRREHARNAYQHIPPTHPDALTMLIDAQHMEKFHAQLVQSVEDAQQREKDIDKEMQCVIENDNRSQRLRREGVIYTGEENGS